ncbi:MAG TPA: UDP-N-acetylmuramate dehydrogenase [Chitinophagaceae bacterium]
MQIQENISLRPFNTFGIDAKAKYFACFKNINELSELITLHPKIKTLVLGGGSNILFTQDFDGLVIKNDVKGIEKIKEEDDVVYVKAGAGENWHQFVLHCIENKWAGVENLSLIPGNVGASPMQNIGAYGVEIKELFHELKAWHLKEKCNYTFTLKDCEFGYRDSVFKRKYKDQFVITSVTYKLRKHLLFNISYGAIQQELEKMGVTDLTIKTVSDAVIAIRTSKLPDPKEIGNAGSFFKNPIVGKEKFHHLKQRFEDIVGYENAVDTVKLAAGWLIEQCGWKGFRRGDAGIHAKQALVLVNYGNASGSEVYNLSEEILQSVKDKFDVELEREVNII